MPRWTYSSTLTQGKHKSWHETPWSIWYMMDYSRVITQIKAINPLCIPNAKMPSFRSFTTIMYAPLIYISSRKFAAALVSNMRTRSTLYINNNALRKNFRRAISLSLTLVFQRPLGRHLRIQDIYVRLACIFITSVSWDIRRRKDV